MKVKAKSPRLIQNCHGDEVGEPKLSSVHSNNAAAAISPTTAGRSPLKMLSTMGCDLYRRRKRHIIIIRMKGGRTRENVASAEPRMPAHSG